MKIHQVATIATVTLLIATGGSFAGMPANYHVKPLQLQQSYNNGEIVTNFRAKTPTNRIDLSDHNGRYGFARATGQSSDWWTRCQDAIQSGEQVPFDSQVNAFCTLGRQ